MPDAIRPLMSTGFPKGNKQTLDKDYECIFFTRKRSERRDTIQMLDKDIIMIKKDCHYYHVPKLQLIFEFYHPQKEP